MISNTLKERNKVDRRDKPNRFQAKPLFQLEAQFQSLRDSLPVADSIKNVSRQTRPTRSVSVNSVDKTPQRYFWVTGIATATLYNKVCAKKIHLTPAGGIREAIETK